MHVCMYACMNVYMYACTHTFIDLRITNLSILHAQRSHGNHGTWCVGQWLRCRLGRKQNSRNVECQDDK